MGREGAEAGDDEFDAARYVVRARRVADLSQRELAEALGLSRASVGRIESGTARVDTGTMASILSLAGLRLAVLDQRDQEVAPFPRDVLRDHAGRRLPAHLDGGPPHDEPAIRGIDSRKGGPPERAWFEHRVARERRRRGTGTPADHPTTSGLRAAKLEARQAARARAEALHPPSSYECLCLDECFESCCLAPCPCQCEPNPGSLDRFRLRHRTD